MVAAKAGLDRRPGLGSPPDRGRPVQFRAPVHGHPAPRSRRRAHRSGQGAVERVLDRCSDQLRADGVAEPLDRASASPPRSRWSGRGLRVLATAVQTGADAQRFGPDSLGDLTLTGLQAMLDPPRAAAASAVAACQTAGIAVKMITGDHAATAASIAARVGVLAEGDPGDDSVLTGVELSRLER